MSDPVVEIDLSIEAGEWSRLADPEALCRDAARAAATVAGLRDGAVEVGLVLTDDAAVRLLNGQWRGKDKPTNVLSFPSAEPPGRPGSRHIGDIVMAYETVAREAAEEGKTLPDHVAHLMVHGVLHCLGYDHETAEDADAMEALEVEALARIGVSDPYAGTVVEEEDR